MGEIVFRFRGYFMAPYGLLLLILAKPSPASFVAGGIVALLGEAIRTWGVGYAGKTTRESVLDAPELVTAGPYAYVRHPLYAGNAIMGIGGLVMASGNAPWGIITVFTAAFFLFYGTVYGVLIPLEENFLLSRFGDAYRDYCRSVNSIFPTLRPYRNRSGSFSWDVAARAESHTFVPFLVVVILIGLKMR